MILEVWWQHLHIVTDYNLVTTGTLHSGDYGQYTHLVVSDYSGCMSTLEDLHTKRA